MTDIPVYVILGIVAIILVLRDVANPNPTPPDVDRMSDSERAAALRVKQEAARARMKQLGIKSLFDGRPAWQRINPMGRAEVPLQQQDARVLTMKRRAR